jgi:hypothetical protein
MLIPKKLIALAIITTFLASIPLAFAENSSNSNGLTRVVYELKVDPNYAKPPGTPGTKVEPSYVLIAQGLISTPMNIYYQSNAPDSDFFTAIQESISEYETKTNKDLFGTLTGEDNLVAGGSSDRRNELAFADLGDATTIAITYAWITRGRTKLIVEFDIIFNTEFAWGNAGDTSETTLGNTDIMDTQNIVTHEMGHCVGLGDLYKDYNDQQTMYGYSLEGETCKRTLNTGDISGLAVLYSS